MAPEHLRHPPPQDFLDPRGVMQQDRRMPWWPSGPRLLPSLGTLPGPGDRPAAGLLPSSPHGRGLAWVTAEPQASAQGARTEDPARSAVDRPPTSLGHRACSVRLPWWGVPFRDRKLPGGSSTVLPPAWPGCGGQAGGEGGSRCRTAGGGRRRERQLAASGKVCPGLRSRALRGAGDLPPTISSLSVVGERKLHSYWK